MAAEALQLAAIVQVGSCFDNLRSKMINNRVCDPITTYRVSDCIVGCLVCVSWLKFVPHFSYLRMIHSRVTHLKHYKNT